MSMFLSLVVLTSAGVLPAVSATGSASCLCTDESSPVGTDSEHADAKSPSVNDTAIAGYLFAHMTKEDYGRLYYSISRDGLHWKLLNGGKRVLGEEYRGHPDICQGHDGRYYLVGNHSKDGAISIWVSDDLVKWSKLREFRPDIWKTPDFKPALRYHGAPKIYFDDASARYLITWHSSCEKPIREDSEQFWRGMRTLYVLSKDLVHFTDPKRLFSFETATIDVIVRREGDRYFAIIKDERYPSSDCPTGKSIRICSSTKLVGPYSEPSQRISPNFREAPTLIPKIDGSGWYLYYEQYPGVSYGCSTAETLDGPWYDIYCRSYAVPQHARHGCMIPITSTQYDAIVAAFDDKAGQQ